MPSINEIKEQKTVVKSVGDFANSLQQIAAARMAKLRRAVLSSRRFVEESTRILRELQLEKQKQIEKELGLEGRLPKKSSDPTDAILQKSITDKSAIIIISTDQGLCGSYNTEIFKKIDEVYKQHEKDDWFVVGSKGQAYVERLAKKANIRYFPYNIPETPDIESLKPLIGMFYYYQEIYLLYSKFVNSITREVVVVKLAVPNIEEVETKKELESGKFIFEPDIDEIIASITSRLRYALFKQQILDSKLALYSAQMMAMKTAADNSADLLKELQLEYNKARRKLIDKKIQEVQAGRALWAD